MNNLIPMPEIEIKERELTREEKSEIHILTRNKTTFDPETGEMKKQRRPLNRKDELKRPKEMERLKNLLK